MRRLPIYFLIDVSESMVGEPIEQVQKGMRQIIQELRMDPYALETVYVSVIAFAGKALSLSPLTELFKFYPPIFPIGGPKAPSIRLRRPLPNWKRPDATSPSPAFPLPSP